MKLFQWGSRKIRRNLAKGLAFALAFSLMSPTLALSAPTAENPESGAAVVETQNLRGEEADVDNTASPADADNTASPADADNTVPETGRKDDVEISSPSDAMYDEDGFLMDGEVTFDLKTEEVDVTEEEILEDGAVGIEIDDLATAANALPEYISLPVYINPLYEDVITEDDLITPEEALELQEEVLSFRQTKSLKKGALRGSAAQSALTPLQEAGAFLREAMKNRIISVEVTINLNDDPFSGYSYQEDFDSVLQEALKHDEASKDPKAGDYLRFQFGGLSDPRVSLLDSELTMYYTITYYDTAEQENELDEAIAGVLSELDLNGKNDDYKIAKIYDYITSHVVYDHANLNDSTYKLKYTAYAALVNGTAVCQGYSNLFYRLCLEAGVEARIVAGLGITASSPEGGNHSWNIVKIGSSYYNIDSTWDAGVSPSKYKYFLKNQTEFSAKHVRKLFNGVDYTASVFDTADSDYPYPDSAKVPTTGIVLSSPIGFALQDGKYHIDISFLPENAYDKAWTYEYSKTESTTGCSLGWLDQYMEITPNDSNGIIVMTFTANADPSISRTIRLPMSLSQQDMAGTMDEVSLTLGGDIGVNFYIDVPQYADINGVCTSVDDQNVIARFKVDGKRIDATGTYVKAVGEKRQYMFTCNVKAMEMSDTIGVKLIYKPGSGDEVQIPLVTSEGNTISNETGYEYSAMSYLEAVPQTDPDADLVGMVNAMKDYGEWNQVYFDHNASGIAPKDLSSKVNAQNLSGFVPQTEGSMPVGLTDHTTSLVLNSTTDIKHYFRVEEGHSISEYMFMVDGEECIPVKADSRYYVRIPGIAAHKLGTQYILSVTDGTDSFAEVYSALSYCEIVLRKLSDDPQNSDLCNVVRSIYLYNAAANQYSINH